MPVNLSRVLKRRRGDSEFAQTIHECEEDFRMAKDGERKDEQLS